MAAYPRFIQIEPTTRCNFTCGFCAGRHMPQRDMALADLRTLVGNLDQLDHVELQGEGEPLLHPDFFAMVECLRTKFPAVKISLITNGSLFTETVVEHLLLASLTSIMVSLESADAEEFQAIRGGKFSRVKRGLQTLMQHKKNASFATPTVGFAVTLLRATYPGLGAIASLYDDLGLDGGIQLQSLQTMSVYRQFYDAEMLDNILQKDDNTQVNQLIVTDASLRQSLLVYQQQNNFYRELYGNPQAQPTCPWLERGLFVSATGNIASCCFIKDTTTHGLAPAGAALDGVLKTREMLLRQLKGGEIPAQCQGCGIAGKMQRHHRAQNPAVAAP